VTSTAGLPDAIGVINIVIVIIIIINISIDIGTPAANDYINIR